MENTPKKPCYISALFRAAREDMSPLEIIMEAIVGLVVPWLALDIHLAKKDEIAEIVFLEIAAAVLLPVLILIVRMIFTAPHKIYREAIEEKEAGFSEREEKIKKLESDLEAAKNPVAIPFGIKIVALNEPVDGARFICRFSIKNENANDVNFIELKLVGIEPPFDSKSGGGVPTDQLLLSAIEFTGLDFADKTLGINQTGHFDVFIVERDGTDLAFLFNGTMPSNHSWSHQNDFSPKTTFSDSRNPMLTRYVEHTMTFEVLGRGVAGKIYKFRISFSVSRSEPGFSIQKIDN